MLSLIGGELYQWDTGRIVKVVPDTDVTVHEVHYSTKRMDYAYVLKTYTEDGVTYCAIPNIILQQSNRLLCYEVCQNSDGEETIANTYFDIIKRNKPEDYVYTETEHFTYAKLEDRVDVLEESSHTHTNKEVLDSITKENIENWNGGDKESVNYTVQTLTDDQKAQARKNIGAISEAELVQPDWEQNDETAKDYIKNRIGGYSILTPKGFSGSSRSITFTKDDSGRPVYAAQGIGGAPFSLAWSSGNTKTIYYKVVIGEEVYDMVPLRQSTSNPEIGTLGDPNLEEYPFFFNEQGQAISSTYFYYNNYYYKEGTFWVELYKYDEQIVKIPSKFLEVGDTKSLTVADYNYTLKKDVPVINLPAGWNISGNASTPKVIFSSSKWDSKTNAPVLSIGGRIELRALSSSDEDPAIRLGDYSQVHTEIGKGYIILASSTSGSTKKFKITVDDSGTITATEVI